MDYVPVSLRVGPLAPVGAAGELFFDDSRQPSIQATNSPPPTSRIEPPPVEDDEGSPHFTGSEDEERPYQDLPRRRRSSSNEGNERTRFYPEVYQRSSSTEGQRKNLTHGNLVVDSPVPEDLLKQVPHCDPPDRDEFTHTRYSAVTCNPAEFSDKNYVLRQQLFARPRNTKILIYLPLKDEGEIPFARTIVSVIQNIEFIVNKEVGPWTRDGWKEIVFCIQSDGHPDQKVLSLLRAMGIFFTFNYTTTIPEIEAIIDTNPRVVNGQSVQVHLYEYCTQFKPVLNKRSVSTPRGLVPVQIIFCLSERNDFRPQPTDGCTWLEAFSKRLQPSMCINIDSRTNPTKETFFHMWGLYFYDDSKVKPDRMIGDMAVYDFKGNLLNRLSAAFMGR